jgi:N utilization substance protein B
MQRSEMRELAFKLIYETEMQKELDLNQLEIFFENHEIEDEQAKVYLTDIRVGIEKNKEEIDNLISKYLKEKWSLDRIAKINLSLIKIAIFEMLYKEIPYKVVINEVVELAKKYSDDSAPQFINGILASIVKEKNLNGEN